MSGVASTLAKKRAVAAGFGTNSKAIPYLNQDFEALRAQCRASGQLFSDPMFPAAPESLGFKELGRNSSKVRGVTWKRPTVRTEPRPGPGPRRISLVPGSAQINTGRVLYLSRSRTWTRSKSRFSEHQEAGTRWTGSDQCPVKIQGVLAQRSGSRTRTSSHLRRTSGPDSEHLN